MFSVIIPTRDRPAFLERAVASVRAQTCKALEILVVNDGTGPVTADARVLENHGRGPVMARNLGLDAARGGSIAFLDDDDQWIDAEHLARAAELLERHPFCFADGVMVFADGSGSRPFACAADARSLARNNTILVSTVCYRAALHARLGCFDTALPYYWDWDWYLRVARSGATLHRQETPAAAITVHQGNMSGAETQGLRAANLAALAAKHGLAGLVLKNHLDIASEGLNPASPPVPATR